MTYTAKGACSPQLPGLFLPHLLGSRIMTASSGNALANCSARAERNLSLGCLAGSFCLDSSKPCSNRWTNGNDVAITQPDSFARAGFTIGCQSSPIGPQTTHAVAGGATLPSEPRLPGKAALLIAAMSLQNLIKISLWNSTSFSGKS